METTRQKIPILDLTGLTSYQRYHGNTYELVLQGTRAVAMFAADNAFYEIAEKFNRNEPIPIMDFLQAQREVKAQMMALKKGHPGKENGDRFGKFNR